MKEKKCIKTGQNESIGFTVNTCTFFGLEQIFHPFYGGNVGHWPKRLVIKLTVTVGLRRKQCCRRSACYSFSLLGSAQWLHRCCSCPCHASHYLTKSSRCLWEHSLPLRQQSTWRALPLDRSLQCTWRESTSAPFIARCIRICSHVGHYAVALCTRLVHPPCCSASEALHRCFSLGSAAKPAARLPAVYSHV